MENPFVNAIHGDLYILNNNTQAVYLCDYTRCVDGAKIKQYSLHIEGDRIGTYLYNEDGTCARTSRGMLTEGTDWDIKSKKSGRRGSRRKQ